MGGSIRKRIAKLVASSKESERYLAWLACLSVIVAVGVVYTFMQHAITMTRTEKVLECPYNGRGAHTHVAECYDAEGNLVCPLRERALHKHDDSCYDKKGKLICGKREVTEEHVHGPGCFRTVTVVDDTLSFVTDAFSTYTIVVTEGDTGANAVASEQDQTTQDDQEQVLEASEKESYRISVTCPDDAGIPEDAQLVVNEVPVASRAYFSYLDQVGEAIPVDEGILTARLFDLSIVDINGNVLQPETPVEVTIELLNETEEAEEVRVAHLSDEKDEPERLDATVESDKDETTVSFEAESFSIYAVVATEKI